MSFDPPAFGSFRHSQHVPGYTGFIPKLQNNFAFTFATSSRLAMRCPPTPDLEAVGYDFYSGQRTLRTKSPLSGTGFLGYVDQPVQSDDMFPDDPERVYTQGGPVNLQSYYDDQTRKVEKMKKENPRSLTQKKNPIRNFSQVPFGDNYYYSGKHMFQTTTKESLDQNRLVSATQPPEIATFSDSTRPSTAFAQDSNEFQQKSTSSFGQQKSSSSFDTLRDSVKTPNSSSSFKKRPNTAPLTPAQQTEPLHDEPLSYRYKVAQALVGTHRCDDLHRQVGERVQAKVVSGNKDMIRLFNFFAKTESGLGHTVIGHEEFLGIVQKLGVYIKPREGMALFGRYDSE